MLPQSKHLIHYSTPFLGRIFGMPYHPTDIQGLSKQATKFISNSPAWSSVKEGGFTLQIDLPWPELEMQENPLRYPRRQTAFGGSNHHQTKWYFFKSIFRGWYCMYQWKNKGWFPSSVNTWNCNLSCFKAVKTGIIISPTQTMHYYKGNPSKLPYDLHYMMPPQNGFYMILFVYKL